MRRVANLDLIRGDDLESPEGALEEWLAEWSTRHAKEEKLKAALHPHTAGSELLDLTVRDLASAKTPS
jgi:hypothetical protein